jgi:hypothetical protein
MTEGRPKALFTAETEKAWEAVPRVPRMPRVPKVEDLQPERCSSLFQPFPSVWAAK